MERKKMNHLNSILLEGTISGKPRVDGEGNTKRCSFVLSSLRRDRLRVETETRVAVMLRDINLVEAAIKNARDGRGVRVVGRLANTEAGGGVYIEADHVEYRPEPRGRE
jgi:hypothetical protein